MKAVVRGVASLFFIVGSLAFLGFAFRSFALWREGETGPLDLQPTITAALLSAVVILLAGLLGTLSAVEDRIELAFQDRPKV